MAGPAQTDRISFLSLVEPLGISPDILKAQKATGDLSYNIFDDAGKVRPEWRYCLALPIDFYRQMVMDKDKKRVMVAARQPQGKVLRLWLDTNMFNVVLTDAYTANGLLAA